MNSSLNGGSAADSSWGSANHREDAAGPAIDEIKRRAADYVEQGKQTAAELTAAIEQQIRKRPAEAVAVAAGIGFAIGLLWSRR